MCSKLKATRSTSRAIRSLPPPAPIRAIRGLSSSSACCNAQSRLVTLSHALKFVFYSPRPLRPSREALRDFPAKIIRANSCNSCLSGSLRTFTTFHVAYGHLRTLFAIWNLELGLPSDLSAEASAKAEAGMAEMGKRHHDEGGELYLPAPDER